MFSKSPKNTAKKDMAPNITAKNVICAPNITLKQSYMYTKHYQKNNNMAPNIPQKEEYVHETLPIQKFSMYTKHHLKN